MVRLIEEWLRPPVELRGPFVTLRRVSHGVEGEWISLRRRSRDFLQPWEPVWSKDVLTPRGFGMFLEYHRDGWRAGTLRGFLIFRNGSGELVGGITLSNIRYGANMTASVGYWMGIDYVRRGYMREALALILDYGFGEMGLNRIEASCMPDNRPSTRLLLRCGFRIEGEGRSYLYINGVWEDHLLFAILAKDARTRMETL